MNNSIQIFNNNNFSVRTTRDDEGNIWFVAKDVAQALEYSEDSNASRLFNNVPDLWKEVKRIHTTSDKPSARAYQKVLCLTEQGLYFFLGRSDKPKALPYQMWIAGEVVPSIRETGSYSVRMNEAEIELKREALNLEKAKFIQTILLNPPFPMTDETKTVFGHEAFKLVSGHDYLAMLPESTEKWYTAGEIGEIVGATANMIGRIAKTNGLKAPEGEANEYGRWIFSKSKYSNREVTSFMYSEAGLDWFRNYYEEV